VNDDILQVLIKLSNANNFYRSFDQELIKVFLVNRFSFLILLIHNLKTNPKNHFFQKQKSYLMQLKIDQNLVFDDVVIPNNINT